MIAVDSSALIAVLRGEPEADRFLQIIDASGSCVVSAVTVLETSMVMTGSVHGRRALADLDTLMIEGRFEVVAHDANTTKVAVDAFLRYGKGRHPAGLNMGDCAAYALAKTRHLALLFKGDDFSRTDLISAAA